MDGGFAEDGQKRTRRDVWIRRQGGTSVGYSTERREMSRTIKGFLFLICFFIALGLVRRLFFLEGVAAAVVLLGLWTVAMVGVGLWMMRED